MKLKKFLKKDKLGSVDRVRYLIQFLHYLIGKMELRLRTKQSIPGLRTKIELIRVMILVPK